FSLVFCRCACNTARKNLSTLRNKSFQQVYIFIVDMCNAICSEIAYFTTSWTTTSHLIHSLLILICIFYSLERYIIVTNINLLSCIFRRTLFILSLLTWSCLLLWKTILLITLVIVIATATRSLLCHSSWF